MAELADALVLGSSVKDVQVQVLLPAPSVEETDFVIDKVGLFIFLFSDLCYTYLG